MKPFNNLRARSTQTQHRSTVRQVIKTGGGHGEQTWCAGIDWQNAGCDDHSLGFSRKVAHGGRCVERVGLRDPDHIQTGFFECFYFSDRFFKAAGIIDQGRNFQEALQLFCC